MNSFKRWFLIIRPFTLSASIAPVVVGLCVASTVAPINIFYASLTLLCAMALQVLSNLVNDYYDFKHGSDGDGRLGPSRAISQGLVSPGQMKVAIGIDMAVALLTGLFLVVKGGWPIIIIGASAILFAWLYSATSYSLSYLGIADFFALAYYGFIASMGTAYIQTGVWMPLAFWLGLACGAISVGILTVNNIRDIRQDEAAGKKTIVVRLGAKFGKWYYALCLLIGPIVAFTVLRNLSTGLIMSVFCLLLLNRFFRAEGRVYNKILRDTGLYDLAFSLLSIVALM